MYTQVDLLYKGQMYYESELMLKHIKKEGTHRFDLYCEGNDRPCICGGIKSTGKKNYP